MALRRSQRLAERSSQRHALPLLRLSQETESANFKSAVPSQAVKVNDRLAGWGSSDSYAPLQEPRARGESSV